MKHVVTIMLLVVLAITGCQRSLQVPVPEMSKIKLVQYEIGMPGSQSPSALNPINPNDKIVIQKILGWISQAKPVGYDYKVPTQSIPPNFLTIKLKNGSIITLEPTGNDNETIYIRTTDVKKTLRVSFFRD